MVWPDLEDLRASTVVGLVHVPIVRVAVVVDCISVVEEKLYELGVIEILAVEDERPGFRITAAFVQLIIRINVSMLFVEPSLVCITAAQISCPGELNWIGSVCDIDHSQCVFVEGSTDLLAYVLRIRAVVNNAVSIMCVAIGAEAASIRRLQIGDVHDVKAAATAVGSNRVGTGCVLIDHNVVRIAEITEVGIRRMLSRGGHTPEPEEVVDLHSMTTGLAHEVGTVVVHLDVPPSAGACVRPNVHKVLRIHWIGDIHEHNTLTNTVDCILISSLGVGPTPNVIPPRLTEIGQWNVGEQIDTTAGVGTSHAIHAGHLSTSNPWILTGPLPLGLVIITLNSEFTTVRHRVVRVLRGHTPSLLLLFLQQASSRSDARCQSKSHNTHD